MSMLIDAYRFGGGGGGGTDPNFSSVTSLLHFDGADASTTFTDVKGKTWTGAGNAQLDTAFSKWGTAALLLDGSGDYIWTAHSSDFTPDVDFTFECWVRTQNIGSIRVIATKRGPSTGWQFQIDSSGTLSVNFWGTYAGGVAAATTVATLSINTWYHVAFTQTGGTWRVFIDGVLSATASPAGTHSASTTQLALGYDQIALSRFFIGHIDDVRVTRGVARYTSTFTPPSAAFPDS